MNKSNTHKEKDGICPVCGAELEFTGLHEIQDDSTRVAWECPECGAEGTRWHAIVFACHKDIAKSDDTPFTEEELKDKDMECGEVCPICGGEICFHGDQSIDGDITEVTWHCEDCGAQGTEVSNIVFSEHLGYEDYDRDGLTPSSVLPTSTTRWIG